ncbi:MAG: type IX secretion system outer membrane channel protein PorV [Paludibacteraceae bacterium]|nr:type IX secretion system outer membrane channel protein PorV [Paludibacteraceae bacterium]
MNKKLLIVSLLCLLTIGKLFAADGDVRTVSRAEYNDVAYGLYNSVYSAVPFLSIAPDARGAALGDQGVATSADVHSQHWNPAKYPFNKSNGGVALSYTPWLTKLNVGINMLYLDGYYRFGQQTVGASLRYFSLGDIPLYDNNAQYMGNASPNEFAIDVSYARLLAKRFSMSVALRFIYSNLGVATNDDYKAGLAVGADIAAFYQTPIMIGNMETNLSWGLNISNIGSKISYSSEESLFIPTMFRLGLNYGVNFDKYNKLSLSAEASKYLVPSKYKVVSSTADSITYEQVDLNKVGSLAGIFQSFADAPGGFKEEMQELLWSVGLEYNYYDMFMVRAGYFNESKNKGNRKFFQVGAGFKLSAFNLDVAYTIALSQTNPLDGTLRFTLGFDIDGIIDLANGGTGGRISNKQ